MAAMIDFIFSRPILTIKQLEVALDMPYMAAKRSMEKLVEAKVLQEITGYARNRVFQATEISVSKVDQYRVAFGSPVTKTPLLSKQGSTA